MTEFKTLLFEKYMKYFKEEPNGEFLSACDTHYNLLCEYNERFNLTRITDMAGSVLLHYIDSIFIAIAGSEKILKDGVWICDVGSGGGFPAFPLFFYIHYQKKVKNAKLTMIESSNKKSGFLDVVIASLDLSKSVRTSPLRAEEAGHESKLREKYDIITARALAFLPTLLEYVSPFMKVGAAGLLMKGEDVDNEKLESKKALSELKLKMKEDFVYEIEGMTYKRRVLIIEKTGQLPKKYPRNPGIPKKTPIS